MVKSTINHSPPEVLKAYIKTGLIGPIALTSALTITASFIRSNQGKGVEPFSDVYIMFVLVQIYSCGHLLLAGFLELKILGKPWPLGARVTINGILSSILISLLALSEDYFTGRGLPLYYPLAGFILGSYLGLFTGFILRFFAKKL